MRQNVKAGELAERPADPTRNGYVFEGWFKDGAHLAYDFNQPVTSSIILNAHWTKQLSQWTRGSSTWSINPDNGPTAGSTKITITPPAANSIHFTQISAGGAHSLALASDGNLYSWGSSSGGQLGRAVTNETPSGKPNLVTRPKGASSGFTWVQAVAGGGYSLAIGTDGNLYSWGSNGYGQLGRITDKDDSNTMKSDPTPKPVDKPTKADSSFTWTKVIAGADFALAFGSDGKLYSWGDAYNGELGRPSGNKPGSEPSSKPSPVTMPSGVHFTQVSAGFQHVLAIDTSGKLYGWGWNGLDLPGWSQQQTMPGLGTGASTPTQITKFGPSGNTWKQVSAGYMHSLGLVANGQLYSSVGCNAHDYCNIAHPSGTAKDFAWKQISAGSEYSLAIGSDGKLYGWGDNSKGQLAKDPNDYSTIADPTKVSTPSGVTYTQVRTGNQHVLALDSDGNLYSWGDNSSGQLGRDTGSAKNSIWASKIPFPEQPEISDIKFDGISGTNRSRNSDGTWSVSTPSHRKGQVDVTISWSMNGQQPDAHLLYTYIGPKYSVGFTSKNGSCPTPSGMPGNQSVVEGEQAKRPYPDPKSDGCMFDGWFIKDTKGDSNVAYDFSQPVTGGISLVAHWSPVDTHWSINPSQGNVLGGQQTTITPPDHSRGIRFNQLSAGGEQANILGFSEGVASDGNAYAWGSNQYGQLGQDPAKTTVQNTPTKVPLPDGVGSDFTYMKIAAGGAHTLAIGSNGILYSWGRNDHGQLGDDSTTDRYKPQPVNNPYTDKSFKAVQISAGAYDSAAIDDQGRVYTWGCEHTSYSDYGTVRSTPTLAKDPNGSSQGLHAVQVSVKWSFILALDEDGNVYAWGYNTNGQLGNGTAAGEHNKDYANDPKPVQDPKDASKTFKATQISVGTRHALAIGKEDGSLYTWGRINDTNYARPTNDPANTGKTIKATQISAGTWHSLAIDQDGNAWGWGWNYYGQTGSGSTSDQQATPIKVTGPNKAGQGFKAVCISASHNHSLAIGQDGNAYAWGKNDYNQLGNTSIPTTGNSPKPIQTMFDPTPLNITGIRFDQTVIGTLRQNADGSVTLATPAHNPGRADVIVDWTLGGIVQTKAHLPYTYEGMLPHAGSSGIMILLAAGLLAAAGAAAAGRHRWEARSLQA